MFGGQKQEENMESRFVLQSIFEFAVIAFIIYGLFFEDRFAETERKVARALKRLFRQTFLDKPYHTNHN